MYNSKSLHLGDGVAFDILCYDVYGKNKFLAMMVTVVNQS